MKKELILITLLFLSTNNCLSEVIELKSGEVIELTPPSVTLGRETDNDISLLVEGISRYHAKLEYIDDCWYLKDLGSTNGTKVEGEIIEGRYRVKGNEMISLGDQKFKFDSISKISPSLPTEKIKIDEFLNKKQDAPLLTNSEPLTFTPKTTASSETISFKVPPAPQATGQVFTPTSLDIKPEFDAKNDEINTDSESNNVNFFGSSTADGHGKNKKSSFLMNALFYIGVISLAVIIILIFLKTEETSKVQRKSVAVKKKEPPFLMTYEKQVTTVDNIFRYYIQIENKSVQFTLDDLKYQRHVSDPKELTDQQLDELKQRVRGSRFLELNGVQEGTAKGYNDDTRRFIVSIDGKFNDVLVKNSSSPNSFIILEDIIEDLSFNEWGVQSVTLTPEELKVAARTSFDLAELKFNNYEAHPMNLTFAIKHYKLSMDNLKSFPNKPDYWNKARKNIFKAEEILNRKVKALNFNAAQSLQMGDIFASNEAYVKITKMLDSSDPRYIKARKWIVKYDPHLNKKKKR